MSGIAEFDDVSSIYFLDRFSSILSIFNRTFKSIRNYLIFHNVNNLLWWLMESDSEDDAEIGTIHRRSLFLLIRTNYNLDEHVFRQAFRVDVEVFELLKHSLSPFLAVSRRNNSLSPREQLLTSLHFLGNGAQYHINGVMHTISKSTVCRCVHRVCRLIATRLMPLYVKWPSTSQIVEAQFYQKARFPHVKGIIDGTLVYIDAPKAEEAIYVSRNNKHALNVVLVCGPKHQFFLCRQ